MSLRGISKKNTTKTQLKNCKFQDAQDCPYTSYEDCPNIAEDCHLKEKNLKEGKKKTDSTHHRLLIFGILGIVVYLLSYIIFDTSTEDKSFNTYVLLFFTQASLSIIAAVIITSVIEMPYKAKEFISIILDAFTSEEYLKKLSEKKLTDLRKSITSLLHKKDVPNMPKGLIRLDEKICDLLKHPYYKIYRQKVLCKSENNEIIKTYIIDYTMYNPYNLNHPIDVDIGFRQHIYLSEGRNLSDIFVIKHFSIKIDGDPFKNITNDVIIKDSVLNTKSDFYNKKVVINTNNGKKIKGKNNTENDEIIPSADNSHQEQLIVSFTDKIHVKLEYCVKVPSTDNHYTKRLRYPVKYYRLDYFVDDDDSKLYGQLIGTLMDQSKIVTNFSEDGKSLTIETFDWLLPQNGVFVVVESKNVA